jgi:protein-tyrosine phosphatase
MIDLHTHILPGFDDGARNFDESVEMVKQAVAEGIDMIVASPRIYDIFSGSTREKLLARTDQFKDILSARGISCKVLPGSEVHLAVDLCESLETVVILTVADGGR